MKQSVWSLEEKQESVVCWMTIEGRISGGRELSVRELLLICPVRGGLRIEV